MGGTDENVQVSYEKHKIFLYKEDFDKFLEGMNEVVDFIKREQGEAPQREYKEAEVAPATENEEPESPDENKGKGFFSKFKF